MNENAMVYLVGAGPGDSGLITVKGMRCLQHAEVVLYDRLCNPALLDEVSKTAELIYVGKNMGNHTLPQEQINALLVAKARQNKMVVRLKGGDPFVFGRGGEEVDALVDAGVPFEVVPGVTAGFAAGAYAGIPLTHRDFTTSVTLITGHLNTRKDPQRDIDWSALGCGRGTLVFYMGLTDIATICQQLIEHGRALATPVAVVSHASTPQQHTLIATLTDAAEQVKLQRVTSPAVIIVGEVVQMHKRLDWFQHRLIQSAETEEGMEAEMESEVESEGGTEPPSDAPTTTSTDTKARKNILIFTGNGKGKSTAAFGMALRAVGHGQRVRILQFMKNDTSVGELAALSQLGVPTEQCGLGFVPKPEHPHYPAHKKAAAQGLARAAEHICSGNYDLIILDEICGTVAHGLLDENEVADLLRRAPTPITLVLTGRYAAPALIELADTVSTIHPLKHAFEQGIPARKGVEF
ncbi:MAG: uroporphyrinogen-III C-methyltransferase [Desulfuromonadaceae bacterium]|nr:uroporphyrinogen-III C-methyltransferase [Desulfuromonadaceae bacterium]